MEPNLKPSEPLSQVVFVHDYFQLVFQEERFNIYNLADLESGGAKVTQDQPGFCDALVSLIGLRVMAVAHSDAFALKLSFELGAQVIVRCDDAAINGPEAFEYSGNNQLLVVVQNT